MNACTSCACHCNSNGWSAGCWLWMLRTSNHLIFVCSHNTTRGECIPSMHWPLVAKSKVHTRYALSSGCMEGTYENRQRRGAYRVCTFHSVRPTVITECHNRYAHPLPKGHVDLYTRLRCDYLGNHCLTGGDYRPPKSMHLTPGYGNFSIHSTRGVRFLFKSLP